MIFKVILEKAGSNWSAHASSDSLGVIAVAGDTRDEAVENFHKALVDHLAVMREEGLETPTITTLDIHESLPIDIAA
jgi:predicted RNase H-like HicB family nuclease